MIKSRTEIKTEQEIEKMRAGLLDWYDAEGRTLPWRVRPEDRKAGKTPDPYAVWLSEIMLQQTTVPHGTPYWHKFLEAFPTVTDLANAERETVLSMWAGLGYYARARNLHKCAQIIRDEYDGVFPKTEAALLKLPGIGPYTAATIAAICFDQATNIVDGNVERVISRIFKVEEPLPQARQPLRLLAGTLADPRRAGDYGQAVMDLGATICTPRSPDCPNCPWDDYCLAKEKGAPEAYPRKAAKKPKPVRYGAAFVAIHNGEVLLETRPDKGLLGGMAGLPGSEWTAEPLESPLDAAPFKGGWVKTKGQVKHVFTHFELHLDVYKAEFETRPNSNQAWADDYLLAGLPTVFKKALKLSLNDAALEEE
ncbi:A/G-specific adenine glycosylase [Litorimonas sp.]|jgi:A/G-specific adenine glycosylase|uniref:A/G-specific adenine glycosylase n=1 Tax=Litorimonas sp. TaxID=1892381 RepID=UPI003A8C4080